MSSRTGGDCTMAIPNMIDDKFPLRGLSALQVLLKTMPEVRPGPMNADGVEKVPLTMLPTMGLKQFHREPVGNTCFMFLDLVTFFVCGLLKPRNAKPES